MFRRSCVLVVEDHDMLRETLRLALLELGFEAACAGDAECALALMRTRPISLAMIDLRLPGPTSGEEFMRTAQDSGISVILMSADHARLEAARQNDPAVVCLAKPFGLGVLRECLERTLMGSGASA